MNVSFFSDPNQIGRGGEKRSFEFTAAGEKTGRDASRQVFLLSLEAAAERAKGKKKGKKEKRSIAEVTWKLFPGKKASYFGCWCSRKPDRETKGGNVPRTGRPLPRRWDKKKDPILLSITRFVAKKERVSPGSDRCTGRVVDKIEEKKEKKTWTRRCVLQVRDVSPRLKRAAISP